MKIYCPKCEWEPHPGDLWECCSPCYHAWHTFATGGVCPKCGKIWRDTQCPVCNGWSKHEAWYHGDGSTPDERSSVQEEVLIDKPITEPAAT